jgi:RNA polymerase sigma factor for flagellar operon FliA
MMIEVMETQAYPMPLPFAEPLKGERALDWPEVDGDGGPALAPCCAARTAHATADRDELILRYAPLVRFVVARLGITLSAILDHDDLLGYGILGLIDAVDRFDPERRVKFETYAAARIRGYIIDQLRALDWLPRSSRQRLRDIERISLAIEQQEGHAARCEEVAATLGLAPECVRQALQDANCSFLSLDAGAHGAHGADDSGEVSLLDMVADEVSPGPAAIVEQMDLGASLSEALQRLPERERQIVELYYGGELTLKQISRVLGISESRICQLHARAIARLRADLEGSAHAYAA